MSQLGLITAILLVLPLFIVVYLGIHAWQRRKIPGAISFMLTIMVVGAWGGTAVLVLVAADYGVARFWLSVMLAVVPFLPVCILATSAQTMGYGHLVKGWRIGLWLLIPLVTAYLSLAGESLAFYVYDVQFVNSDSDNIGWINQYGKWAIVHLAYSYALVAFSIVLLVRQFNRMRFRTYRMRILLLLFGLILPFAANIANSLFMEVHYFINPIIFNISAPILFVAIFRYRLFEVLPVAREQAFEQMDDAIIIVDNSNRIVDVNPSAAKLAAQSAPKIIETPLFTIFPAFEAAFNPLLETFPNHHPIEVQHVNSTQYFGLSISPIMRDSERVGKLIILHNTTQQRLAEARAYRLEMERERVKTVAQFIESASHEFRTPLSIIKNSAFIISRTDDAAKRSDKLTQIDEQVNRINQLVDALLNVVRLNAKVELDTHSVDINGIIEKAFEQVRLDAIAKQINVRFDLAAYLVPIMGDAAYLTDALVTVLHNAIRYTPNTGEISVTSTHDSSSVHIRVQDSGIGIEPEHLPNIFDVFYRADKAHSTAGFGTGLAIAQRVISLHQGHIQVESRPGEGTLILITLPRP